MDIFILSIVFLFPRVESQCSGGYITPVFGMPSVSDFSSPVVPSASYQYGATSETWVTINSTGGDWGLGSGIANGTLGFLSNTTGQQGQFAFIQRTANITTCLNVTEENLGTYTLSWIDSGRIADNAAWNGDQSYNIVVFSGSTYALNVNYNTTSDQNWTSHSATFVIPNTGIWNIQFLGLVSADSTAYVDTITMINILPINYTNPEMELVGDANYIEVINDDSKPVGVARLINDVVFQGGGIYYQKVFSPQELQEFTASFIFRTSDYESYNNSVDERMGVGFVLQSVGPSPENLDQSMFGAPRGSSNVVGISFDSAEIAHVECWGPPSGAGISPTIGNTSDWTVVTLSYSNGNLLGNISNPSQNSSFGCSINFTLHLDSDQVWIGLSGGGVTRKLVVDVLDNFTINALPATTTGALTTQPLTTQTLTTQSLTTQLLTTQPLTTQSLTTQPLTTQSLTTQSLTTQPLTTQPLTTQPLTTQSLTTQPLTTQSLTTGFSNGTDIYYPSTIVNFTGSYLIIHTNNLPEALSSSCTGSIQNCNNSYVQLNPDVTGKFLANLSILVPDVSSNSFSISVSVGANLLEYTNGIQFLFYPYANDQTPTQIFGIIVKKSDEWISKTSPMILDLSNFVNENHTVVVGLEVVVDDNSIRSDGYNIDGPNQYKGYIHEMLLKVESTESDPTSSLSPLIVTVCIAVPVLIASVVITVLFIRRRGCNQGARYTKLRSFDLAARSELLSLKDPDDRLIE